MANTVYSESTESKALVHLGIPRITLFKTALTPFGIGLLKQTKKLEK